VEKGRVKKEREKKSTNTTQHTTNTPTTRQRLQTDSKKRKKKTREEKIIGAFLAGGPRWSRSENRMKGGERGEGWGTKG